ncbi:hypothetical protein TRIATDRAFT_278612 [Trichoderma atroviride IMI 206040]|uniref:Uncharacterized protein n=1 Tax=Hypocrea atroviridis (strain ATCC 20476 / IMI 206040) TaxID=452589 RepID=G9PA84_HYPAI|nr:uncharacterized protein TRIATDRAFT_278612 [Trichoderma atroviride IMI 206040]EHK39922.1 hypothetical protein TRIATDRAFT_278612 [Trichoderma atroviride IMI 206040]
MNKDGSKKTNTHWAEATQSASVARPESLSAAHTLSSLAIPVFDQHIGSQDSRVGGIKITPRPGGFLRGQLDITAACGRRIAADSSLQALVNDIPTYLETRSSHHGAEKVITMREAKGVRNRHP